MSHPHGTVLSSKNSDGNPLLFVLDYLSKNCKIRSRSGVLHHAHTLFSVWEHQCFLHIVLILFVFMICKHHRHYNTNVAMHPHCFAQVRWTFSSPVGPSWSESLHYCLHINGGECSKNKTMLLNYWLIYSYRMSMIRQCQSFLK